MAGLLGFFDTITRTEAAATVMAQLATVDNKKSYLIGKLPFFHTVNCARGIRAAMETLTKNLLDEIEIRTSLQAESRRLMAAIADFNPGTRREWLRETVGPAEVHCVPDDAPLDTLEWGIYNPNTLDSEFVRLVLLTLPYVENKEAATTSTPSLMDLVSLVRLSGLSCAFRRAALDGPMGRLSEGLQLLAEVNATVENEILDLQPLMREVHKISIKITRISGDFVKLHNHNRWLRDCLEHLRAADRNARRRRARAEMRL